MNDDFNPDYLDPDSFDEEESEHYISKTSRKRQMEALQKLGENLVSLKEEELREFPLSNILLEAILAAKKIHQNSARRRQMQYIGKLMRSADAEAIEKKFSEELQKHQKSVDIFHQIEKWRDRLIDEGDAVIEELLSLHPHLERNRIRQLLRNAHKEAVDGKRGKSARTLFKYLRDEIG